MRQLIKNNRNILNFALIKIFGEGTKFLFPILIAYLLNPEIYGSFSLSLMIVFFIITLFISSSQTPFIISASKENKKDKKINKSFTVQLIFFIFSIFTIFIGFVVFKNTIILFTNLTQQEIIYLFFAYIGLSLRSLINSIFLGLNKKNISAFVDIIFGISQIILILFFYLIYNTTNINLIFSTYFISSIITIIILIPTFPIKKLTPLRLNKHILKKQWSHTKWQIFGLTAVYLINWGDNLVLKYFVSLEEIGIYNLSYQIFKGFINLTYIINSFYLPEISKNIENKQYLNNYFKNIRKNIIILGILILIITYFLIPIFFYFYNDEFSASKNILYILLLGIIFKLWSVFYIPLFNVTKNYKYLQIMNIIQLILNIILDIILVIHWGIIGVAVATIISYIIRAIMDEIYFQLYIKEKIQL